jgi:hypothetical protein
MVSHGKAYEAMVEYFSTQGWQFTELERQPALRLNVDSKGIERKCLAIAEGSSKYSSKMTFYSVISVQVEEDDIELQVSELLHRINYGISMGNFTIDWFSGVVHSRTSVRVSAIELSSALIEPVVNNNLALVSKYFPAILAVNEEEMLPTEALARLEPKSPESATIASPSSPNGGKAFEEMVSYFTKYWKCSQVEDKPILEMRYSGKSGKWRCYAIAEEKASAKRIVFLSIVPVVVPQEKREIVGEYLHRINYILDYGNFELNFDTGEVRYKTSIEVTESKLNDGLIHYLSISNTRAVGNYLSQLEAVIEGKFDPEDLEDKLENDIWRLRKIL